jgi:phosphate transport system substrate-binding protein
MKRTEKLLWVAAIITLFVMQSAASAGAFAAEAATQRAERIVVDGSTGVAPLVAALAEAYRERHPGVTIEIGKGLGTRARFDALSKGAIDIAMASHGLRVDEIKRQGMIVHEIGKVPVVFAVNKTVSASDLTQRQVCDIYAGKVDNWSQLGAEDLRIVPVTRPDTEVDTEVVRLHVDCLTNLKMPESVKVAPKAGNMARELASIPGAIGMTTMTIAGQSGGSIKPLSLQGVAPTAANVQNRRYALTRDSFVITRGAPSPAVERFIAFIRSDAGEKIVAANGAIPAR